ncbi:MAG: hypothetical protein ACR2QM_14545 [Longimicrobiales bacterium]
MNTTNAHRRVPGWGTVLPEQARTVGLAIRRELLLVLAFGVGATVFGLVMVQLRPGVVGGGIPPAGDLSLMAGTIGFFFPLLVWKAEKRHEPSHLWTLPVNHQRHALTKVLAGWGWLMLLLGVSLAWLLAVGQLMGMEAGIDGTRWVLGDVPAGANAAGPGGSVEMAWSTPAWQWFVPFTAATAAYALGSAFVLATDHVWGWGIGIYVLLGTIVVMLEVGASQRVFEPFWEGFFNPPFGLDTLLSSGEETLTYWHQPLDGERGVEVWNALPTFRAWVTGTLLWTGLALVALGAASMRHREG